MTALGWDSTEEEALSFCNLPLGGPKEASKEPKLPLSDDFEFTSWPAILLLESDDMCVADDVISDGQLLPFRPPESSGRELLGSAEGPAVSSRCQSLDRSWCFTSGKQGSGLCDSEPDRRRASTGSGGFFAMASPKPGMTGGEFPGGGRGEEEGGNDQDGAFPAGAGEDAGDRVEGSQAAGEEEGGDGEKPKRVVLVVIIVVTIFSVVMEGFPAAGLQMLGRRHRIRRDYETKRGTQTSQRR